MSELAEVRSVLSELQRGMGRLEGTGASILTGMAAHNLRDEELFDSIDKRLRRVESRQTWMSGFAGGIGAIIGIITHKFTTSS